MTPGPLLTRTKQWLRRNDIRISKQLGQHFLVDEQVLERIIEYSDLSQDEQVLEIGTGNGVLTQALAEHVQQVFTIEKDKKLYQILSNELSSIKQITLIQGDATKIEWPHSDKLVANLPYSISSPVLFRVFESKIPSAILMLQKEFGERLTAQPNTKQYGRLTVMAAYHSMIELLEVVKPEAFYPPPAVSSVLVRVIRKEHPKFMVKDQILFGQLVIALFNQRRKKIRTPLKALLGEDEFQQLQDKIAWLDQRVETLNPEQLAEIANIICEERST